MAWKDVLEVVQGQGWIEDEDDLANLEATLEAIATQLSETLSPDTEDLEDLSPDTEDLEDLLRKLGLETAAGCVWEMKDYTRYASYDNVPESAISAAADLWGMLQGELEGYLGEKCAQGD